MFLGISPYSANESGLFFLETKYTLFPAIKLSHKVS